MGYFEDGRDLGARIGAHIAALTAAGPRHRHNPSAVRAARDYIVSTLTELDQRVTEERYGDEPHQVNVVVELQGKSSAGIVEVGAHWDSVAASPGADDNASGVAGLLEIARELGERDLPQPVRLCFFGEEEVGGFPGSSAHLRAAADRGDHIQAAIVLEMIGYRDSTPGSQQLPEAAAAALSAEGLTAPEAGDFIAVVGDSSAAHWVNALATAAASLNRPLPVLPLAAPAGAVADAGRSDHSVYWGEGIPGVMITDTANFRNPHYHQPTDLPNTLDLDFAAQVIRMISAALKAQRP